MIKKEKPTIYTQFEINTIIFFATMLLFLPLVLVFSYLFEIDQMLNINRFMLWVVILNLVITLIGTIILALRKDQLRRKVKASYRGEFFYLIFLFVFGLLGFVVVYDYMGGNRDYIANIIVVLFAGFAYLAIFLGKTFFKFDYMKKK